MKWAQLPGGGAGIEPLAAELNRHERGEVQLGKRLVVMIFSHGRVSQGNL
jgi:hypothetical protein